MLFRLGCPLLLVGDTTSYAAFSIIMGAARVVAGPRSWRRVLVTFAGLGIRAPAPAWGTRRRTRGRRRMVGHTATMRRVPVPEIQPRISDVFRLEMYV